jgi:hypothetical protein
MFEDIVYIGPYGKTSELTNPNFSLFSEVALPWEEYCSVDLVD